MSANWLECDKCGSSVCMGGCREIGMSMKNGAELIVIERQRQVSIKGWTSEHDDEHSDNQLLSAAESYIQATVQLNNGHYLHEAVRVAGIEWPWDDALLKVSPNPIRNLVKAGALIAAEIDRIQRERGIDA